MLDLVLHDTDKFRDCILMEPETLKKLLTN